MGFEYFVHGVDTDGQYHIFGACLTRQEAEDLVTYLDEVYPKGEYNIQAEETDMVIHGGKDFPSRMTKAVDEIKRMWNN